MMFGTDEGDDSGSVADALNLFGLAGGFDALWERLDDKEASLEIKLALAHSFDGCIEQISLPCLDKVGSARLDAVWLLL
jgi:hypothetical protein